MSEKTVNWWPKTAIPLLLTVQLFLKETRYRYQLGWGLIGWVLWMRPPPRWSARYPSPPGCSGRSAGTARNQTAPSKTYGRFLSMSLTVHGTQTENSPLLSLLSCPSVHQMSSLLFFFLRVAEKYPWSTYNCLFRCAVPCSFHFEISLKHQCHTIFFTSFLLHESTVEPTLDSWC